MWRMGRVVAAWCFIVMFIAWPAAVMAETLDWWFQNKTGRTLNIELYGKTRSHVWPGNGSFWSLPPDGRRYINRISCNPGEHICYGAWAADEQAQYWGAGRGGNEACTDCCYYCRGGGTQLIALTQRPMPPVARSDAPPLSATGPSFDCKIEMGYTEQTICHNGQLAQLDRDIAAAYAALLKKGSTREKIVSDQRSWLRTRNACGMQTECILLQMRERLATLHGLLSGALASPTDTPPAKRYSQAISCHLQSGRAPKLAVTVKGAMARARTGDRIVVAWNAKDINAACGAPLYLVLTTAMRTRFEGEGFLALSPGTEGPYGIKHRRERTRIFVPLHVGASQRQGEVVVKVYEAGPLTLDWSLVEVPKLTDAPQGRADLGVGRERVSASATLGDGISIVGGNPTIMVRDQFAIDAAKQIIRSNSGEFELQVFDGFYRVLDVKTDELLIERSGWDPNFSPTGRFLGAYAEGPGYEIIDLYSMGVVTSNAVLNRERGFAGNVHLAAWSPGDAIFALSVWRWGGIEVQQSLVDGSHRSLTGTASHNVQGTVTPLHIDMDVGALVYQASSIGWESLLDRTVGSDAAGKKALAQLPLRRDRYGSEPNARHGERERLAEAISLRMRPPLLKLDGHFPEYNPENPLRVAPMWRLGGPLTLSHHCLYGGGGDCSTLDRKIYGSEADYQEDVDRLKRLTAARVVHTGPAARPAVSSDDRELEVAEARLTKIRGTKAGRANEAASGQMSATLWDRLERFHVSVDARALKPTVRRMDAADLQKDDSVEKQEKYVNDLAASIVAAVPSAASRLKKSGFDPTSDDAFFGLKKEARYVDLDGIEESATWSVGERSYWLIRTHYSHGASSRNWLLLLHGTKSGPTTVVDLTHRLKTQVGSKSSGLDAEGKLETTSERAATLGFGAWPSSLDRVVVASDRHLIASGLWTQEQRRWVVLFDLKTDQIRLFNRDIPEAATFSGFALSADARTLIQLNTNGHLFFHDVASAKVVLRGIDIDEELVLYDPKGYYASSPEGAHFIFLKFPGIAGYHSFQQFARTLSRPDLIGAILNGKSNTPDPRLTPPPTISMEVEVQGAGEERRAKLKLSAASTVGLAKAQIFVDGRLAGEHTLAGGSAVIEATVALNPESRWVTAVAVDSTGYESVPRGRALSGAGKATASRLHILAIGTDLYDDTAYLPILSGAKTDAKNFANGMAALKGTLYGEIEVTSFLDATGLVSTLPSKIREIATSAGERDTILLFAAGHGVRDDTTGQFYLTVRETRRGKLDSTAISWKEIAGALDGAKARVIVLLDACKSGAAGGGGTNDDAVSAFLDRKASITVIAAAKGRQDSLEFADGGAFTTALVKAIAAERKTTDTNGNGAIELAELYGAIKREVVTKTHGEQTPWIARNLMVGETPLF